MESRLTHRAAVVERVSAGAALALGLLAGFGASFGHPRLGQWIGGLPTTAFVTALMVCLLAVGHLVRPRWATASGTIVAVTLGLAVSFVVARVGGYSHPLADWWQHHVTGAHGPGPIPSYTTAYGLGGWAIGLQLATAGRQRAAQVAAVVPALIGGLAILSFVYGDRLATIQRSSFPNTATAAPASYAFLFGAVALLAATPEVGVSAWITIESPGRRAVRRLAPPVIALPLLLAGVSRWTHLARSVGDARAWALVMSALTIGIVVIATIAVHLIDNVSNASQRAEVTQVRLDAALQAAAVADLAQSLSASLTAEEVAAVVNDGVCRVLGAEIASFGVIDRFAGVLRMQHGQTIEADVAERFDHPSLDDALVVTDAARTGEMVLVSDYADYARRYPGSDATPTAFGSGAWAGLPLRNRSGETFGALVVSWPGAIEFEDTMRATLATIGPLVAQSLERARMTDDLAISASRNASLAELSESLAVAAGTEDVVRVMCERVAGPIGAIEAIVGLVDQGGRLLHCAVGSAAGKRPIEWDDSMDADRPLVVAARTGQVLFFPDRDAVAAGNPEGLDRFDAVGLGAAACVPLRNLSGELFGSFGVGWSHPVQFDPQMRTLLSTIAELSAQTLQRAWLADERGRDAARARQVATFAEALAVASSSARIAELVGLHVAAIFDAEIARLLLDEDLGESRGETDWPEETSATIPLMTGDDQREIGWLCVRWVEGVPIDETSAATLLTITELVSQTIERAHLTEAEHRLADDLQRRTLHPIPDVTGFDIAALYQPAAIELGMGGDWFEVMELDGDRVGLIVGDVVGHGVEAAGEMSQISGVLATLLRVGTPIEDLFARVHEAVRITGPRFVATAVVAVVDRTSGQVRYMSAGHPPGLIVSADGCVTRLDAGRQPVIGMPSTDGVPGVAELGEGSTLLVFTDGLIERRGEDLEVGLDRLGGIMTAQAAANAETLVERALSGCTDGRRIEDDIALVAIRRIP